MGGDRGHQYRFVGLRAFTPHGQKIHPSQFPEKYRRFNNCSQPKAKLLDQNLQLTPPKPRLNPAQAAAAHGRTRRRPHCHRPNTAHAIPPHTSQALEHPTAQQPNMHRPASSKLTFEPVKCTCWGTPSARTPKQLQYATLGLLHEILHGVFFTV